MEVILYESDPAEKSIFVMNERQTERPPRADSLLHTEKGFGVQNGRRFSHFRSISTKGYYYLWVRSRMKSLTEMLVDFPEIVPELKTHGFGFF